MLALRDLTGGRRALLLFALMVLLPGTVFGILIVRSVRDDRAQSAERDAQRQRQIVQVFERQLNSWLFSDAPDGAGADAALRFRVEGNQIRFPAFQLALPVVAQAARPPADMLPDDGPTRQVITDFYYPRILVLLRDFKSGAQYFLRLRSLIVLLPGNTDGYAIGAPQIAGRANEWLSDLCAGTRFTAVLSIGDVQDRPTAAARGPFALAGFPFFQVVFQYRENAGDASGYAFAYAMSFLIIVAILGSGLVYRAVSHDARLSQLRSDFVSAVSHEFRSPLSSMLALLERLDTARIQDPGKLAEYHAVIRRDAQRLSLLVTRLLDFAQIESGKERYALERVELGSVARDAVEVCRHHRSADRLRIGSGEAGPKWILGDRTALQGCIQNLLENAIKYSGPDQPIEVMCSSSSLTHDVEVRDQGIGIPRSEQPRIFEKFYRGGRASDLDVPGVGIGLALVKHVVECHGGSVSVDSELGVGSRFRLHLPKADG